MYMQSWYRLKFYPNDFLNLVYNYYSKHSNNFYPCTYYRLDIENSVCDKDNLQSAAFEDTGSFSGLQWEKILLLPVYNVEHIPGDFIADERGFGQFEQMSSFNFPNAYDFYPTTYDFVLFQASSLNIDGKEIENRPPIYRVNHISAGTVTEISFWKVNLKIYHTSYEEIESQVRKTYAFFDYEKRIYPINESAALYNLLEKNTKLTLNDFYKSQPGFYFGT